MDCGQLPSKLTLLALQLCEGLAGPSPPLSVLGTYKALPLTVWLRPKIRRESVRWAAQTACPAREGEEEEEEDTRLFILGHIF